MGVSERGRRHVDKKNKLYRNMNKSGQDKTTLMLFIFFFFFGGDAERKTGVGRKADSKGERARETERETERQRERERQRESERERVSAMET